MRLLSMSSIVCSTLCCLTYASVAMVAGRWWYRCGAALAEADRQKRTYEYLVRVLGA